MAGITTFHKPTPLFHFLQNLNRCHIWHNHVIFLIKIYILAFFSFLLMGLFIKLNLKLYFRKTKTKRKKFQRSHYFSNNKINLAKQLIPISIYKLAIMYITYIALKTKLELKKNRHEEKSLNYKAYFLSPEHFQDTYEFNDNSIKYLQTCHCLSKLKISSFKTFYQFVLLLSGDIARNPGPTSYPCSKCSSGVRVGVFCTTCKMWIHKKCEGLSSSEMTRMSKLDWIN